MNRSYLRRAGTFFAAALIYAAGAASVLGLEYALRGPGAENTSAVFGDWRLDCPPKNQRTAFCHLSQDLIQEGTGVRLAHLEVSQVGEAHRLAIVVPRGVLLEPGLGFAVGARPQQKLIYQTCDIIGCAAFVPLEGGVGDAMSTGGTGRLSMADRNGAQLALQYSLRGFRDGLATLDREAFRRTSVIGSLGL